MPLIPGPHTLAGQTSRRREKRGLTHQARSARIRITELRQMTQRLFRMGPMELACRSRQELYKWLERTGIAGHKVAPHNSLFIEAGSDPVLALVHKRLQQQDFAGVALWSRDWFCETVAPRFFEGTVCAETPVYLGEYFRETLDHIVAAAEEARRGRFCLLG